MKIEDPIGWQLHFLKESSTNDLEEVAETMNTLGTPSCRAGLYLEAMDYYGRELGIQMKLGVMTSNLLWQKFWPEVSNSRLDIILRR
jgi:hypothetical protein